MDHSTPQRALFALATVAALLAVPAGAVAASAPAPIRAVGELFVDAQGRASGENLVTDIVEAQGVIAGFASLALGTTLFESVSIDGFAQAEKIHGVGSSSLVLKGTNAVVAVYDNSNAALKVHALQSTTIRYALPAGVHAEAHEESRAVVDLRAPDGAYLGSVVAVGGDAGRADSVRVARGEVQAVVEQGAQVVFLGMPVSLADESHHQAVVRAAAEGRLAATYVTELDGGSVAASQVDYVGSALATTSADARGSIQTHVKSRAGPAMVLAYDLAYETLPARSASDVAVYADGRLATRAASPAEVLANARQGTASFHAIVEEGRAHVLASTPDFSSLTEHRLAVTAGGGASTEAQARAESRSEGGSRVYGGFEYHANGKLTGDFVTGILPSNQADLHAYTALEPGLEVFRTVRVEGNGEGSLATLGDHRFRIDGPRADLTIVDDAYATLLIDAEHAGDAVFRLAAGVKARAESDDVVRVEGPRGQAGVLILADAGGETRPGTGLVVDESGDVRARLEEGSRVVFRAATDKFASDAAVADGIARGHVGAQLLAGVQGADVATSGIDYFGGVSARLESLAHGKLQATYGSSLDAARSFVLDTRGTTVAAKSASDVRVLVDGVAAVPVATAEAALAPGAHARYFAETGVDGSLRLVVNTAVQTGGVAQVLIESRLEDAAREAATTDAFGAFKVFYDGTAVGSFVTLRAAKDAGAVSDVTLIAAGQPVFTSLVAGASPFLSGGVDGATTLVLENREAKLEFTDTTSGYVRVAAKEATEAALRLAPGLVAQARGASVVELRTEDGGHLGSLILTGLDGRASAGSRFVVEQESDAPQRVRAVLEEGAQMLFRTHVGVESELSEAQRAMVNGAIASGRVAGQVMVQTQSTLSASARQAAEAHARLEASMRDATEAGHSVAVAAQEHAGQVTSAVTAAYSADVQMVTAATRQRVDVTISSTSEVGKTLLVSLDAATVPGLRTGDALILFDGEPAAAADSYADVLDANDDGGVAEYFVLAGEAGTQVLVSVPHFSVHTVTLQERPAPESPVFAYATVVLGLVVAVETALLLRRARRSA